MKFTVLSPILLGNIISANTQIKDQFLVASEVLNHVDQMDIVIDLLKKLSKTATSLEDVEPQIMIKQIVKVTNKPFSDQVYQYFGISKKEILELHKNLENVPEIPEIAPRFGIPNAAMSALDPSSVLLGYGCWCRFGGSSKGRGQALDDIDSLCKKITLSYECLRLDVLNEDGAYCDPVTEPYSFSIGDYIMTSLNLPGMSTNENCQQNNKGNRCAAQTCELELSMLTEYYRGVLQDPNFTVLSVDPNNQHVKFGGPFDPADSCGNPGNPSSVVNANQQQNSQYHAGNHPMSWSSDKECCGTFPNRVPYHTLNGQRACCNGKTYNTLMNNCCSGVVQISC